MDVWWGIEGQEKTVELLDCLRVVSLDEVVNRGRLRWYEHVELKKTRVTGYRHARNYRLRGQRERREVGRRGTSV